MATAPKSAALDVASPGWLTSESILKALGSLKFTVGLFAISLLLVLVGTLAQDEMNMQDVKSRYFLSWIAMLHFDDLFPQAFLPHTKKIPGILPIPGGALVGVMLMVNLLAAKITRFRMHAQGGRLAAGIAFMIAGFAIAGLIIASGNSSEGLQGEPRGVTYPQLWGLMMASLSMLAMASCWWAAKASTWTLRITFAISALVMVAFLIFAVTTGYRIGDPGLRIVWQLLKGVGAGAVMLVGCQLLFDKQGGNVLLHLGVGLLMVGQFAFGDRQLEQRLSLVEDEMTNTFVNFDQAEVVFLTENDKQKDLVAVPLERLIALEGTDGVLQDESLPVDIKVVEVFENSQLADAKGQGLPATTGLGEEIKAVELPRNGGANPQTDLPSAYIELLEKDSSTSLGFYLVSMQLSDGEFLFPEKKLDDLYDDVTVGEQTFKVGMKFHREVKPYWVKLEDVRRVNYSGTNTPRDYSSFIRIVDEETGEDRRERVWMNNPLRYRGETFFQSSYSPVGGGKEWTSIQVVQNSGWLIPYVSCSIIALGMAAHFWGTLVRFVGRRRREDEKQFAATRVSGGNANDPLAVHAEKLNDGETEQAVADVPATGRRWVLPLSLAAVGLFAIACLVPRTVIMNKIKPAERGTELDYYALGQLPVQYGGRVMPLDAYARQTMKAMSNKESVPIRGDRSILLPGVPPELAKRVDGKKLSALQWLMEVATDDPAVYELPMFRIDADEVLAELGGLDRRENKLYSYDEVNQNRASIRKQMQAALKKQESDPQSLTFKEKKLMELEQRKQRFVQVALAMRVPMPRVRPKDMWEPGWTEMDAQVSAFQAMQAQMQSLADMNVPRIVPPSQTAVADALDQLDWSAFSSAFFDDLKATIQERNTAKQPGIETFSNMITAYDNQDFLSLTNSVDAHLTDVQSYAVPGYASSKVSVERWMNATHPNTISIVIYILGLVMCLGYFAFGNETLRKVAWGTILISFLVHSVVLFARIYVTGRAPVINLYSSAVFIGWGAVLFGLITERVYRYGTGSFLAAISGAITLQVAWALTLSAGQGDTMPVLQAVLDTQFWLSTHVISVSLGYVATMVAGVLGIAYLVAGWMGKGDKPLREIYSSVYGATCLGILFSTIGTILGGLWADDSWGRFWGWDPKENGALLIVIWNALMLHARWDKMVAGRGFAVLAIFGNIVTAWSWFGTNELGIGLHSYGFTEGTKFWLATFFASQAVFMVLGMLFWRRRDSVQV